MTVIKQYIWKKFTNPIIYIPIILCLLLLYIPYIVELNFYSFKMKGEIKNIKSGFLIKTTGCKIPSLEPFDKSILKYIFRVKPFSCSTVLPLVQSTLNTIYIDEKQLPFYNITSQDTFNCCYQPFWRQDPSENSPDNSYKIGDCVYFNSSTKISEEYIKVICRINKTVFHTDYHSFVPIKKKNKKIQGKLNILIIGLDAVSRLNFHRQLQLTKKYLEKLEAIEMIGYNKVGDNTFPNLIPVLTGKSISELENDCWENDNKKFDNCSFIWKNYSQEGYLTAFAEDSSWMGLFNYQRKGFQHQPTDYYWRTFNYIAEKEIGHEKTYNSDLCIGPRKTYKVLLEYIHKFTLSLKNQTYFGLFWGTSLSHDALNYPQIGDRDYKKFFQLLVKNKVLKDTVLIFMSDHGIRWGDIRSTHQGNLEERLPFLYFLFPKWFKKKFPTAIANLKRNTKRLTTPYDLHATLEDLLNSDLTSKKLKQRSKDLFKRGISLFLPIPENRTCEIANISDHWCTCQQSTEINITNLVVQSAAEFIVSYINNLLIGYKSCSVLRLDEIINAQLSVSADYLKNNKPIHDYTIIVRTIPGEALFESTVRCIECDLNNVFDLTGTVSRLNLYGNQSLCITNYQLKLYCYCAS